MGEGKCGSCAGKDHVLIYVKGASDRKKHSKMRGLIRRAESELIRRRFIDIATLLPAVYASLVSYLEEHQLILNGLSMPPHATVLLFGKEPQRFLPTSEIKCAHFHGTEVAKPIPSYQIYKGTIFSLVDEAVDFVMAKLALRVGTRAESVQAPVTYEIPREVVVTEGIVNAVAHRDYASTGSVQVILFADRLEIWNPGRLPASLTLEQLREPHGSVPHNPLLAESLYLTKYIERMGTGTRDMIQRCREEGLPEPQFQITDGFTLTLQRPFVAEADASREKWGEKWGAAILAKRRKIAQAMMRDPRVTIARLATELGMGTTAIENHLKAISKREISMNKNAAEFDHAMWAVLC